MTPVDIGDTQGTLQAKKMFETLYKRPETLVWVYISHVCIRLFSWRIVKMYGIFFSFTTHRDAWCLSILGKKTSAHSQMMAYVCETGLQQK